MDMNLARILYEKSALTADTKVVSGYLHRDFNGKAFRSVSDFVLVKVILGKDNTISFVAVNKKNGLETRIAVSDITEIDGMDIKRFAKLYNLNEKGEIVKTGKRRGRRPKGWVDPDLIGAEPFTDDDDDDLMDAA